MCRLAVILLFCFSAFSVQRSAFSQPFTDRDIAFLGKRELSTDWSTRVVANGGAMPSQNTIQAMETLRTGCIALGITNKIYSLCVFVPDSLIAATTPLFLHYGATLWTNINFGTTNLDINGLKGDGTTKVLDTGVKSKDIQFPANGATIGLTVLVTEADSNRGQIVMGQQDADLSPGTALYVSNNGESAFYAVQNIAGTFATSNDWGRVGYVSGNRNTNGGTTNLSIYVASPLESHKVLKTISGDLLSAATADDFTISVFADKHGGTNTGWASQRMSLAMVHDGWTETQSSNLWVLFKACREQLGGGTGDQVHDYNRKVVAAGGAAISTTTSNALRTFYSGIDTDGNLYKMVAVNCYVPDNLTAARTPIVWQAGSEVWTNFNFGTTNLSVHGLTGNGTDKYLGTGIIPATAINRGFGDISAGISQLTPTNLNSHMFADASAAANSHYAILIDNGTAQFYCWRFNSVNANFVFAHAARVGFTNGWISGSRTAANAIAVYGATASIAHFSITNGTGAQTGAAIATYPVTAFAINSIGTVAGWTASTIAFQAAHAGLTQTQSSNLWNRVRDFRTSIGGVVP